MDPQDVLAVLRERGYMEDMRASQARTLMASYGVTGWRAGRSHRVTLPDLAQALCEALDPPEGGDSWSPATRSSSTRTSRA